jgi:hypothetical protein
MVSTPRDFSKTNTFSEELKDFFYLSKQIAPREKTSEEL